MPRRAVHGEQGPDEIENVRQTEVGRTRCMSPDYAGACRKMLALFHDTLLCQCESLFVQQSEQTVRRSGTCTAHAVRVESNNVSPSDPLHTNKCFGLARFDEATLSNTGE